MDERRKSGWQRLVDAAGGSVAVILALLQWVLPEMPIELRVLAWVAIAFLAGWSVWRYQSGSTAGDGTNIVLTPRQKLKRVSTVSVTVLIAGILAWVNIRQSLTEKVSPPTSEAIADQVVKRLGPSLSRPEPIITPRSPPNLPGVITPSPDPTFRLYVDCVPVLMPEEPLSAEEGGIVLLTIMDEQMDGVMHRALKATRGEAMNIPWWNSRTEGYLCEISNYSSEPITMSLTFATKYYAEVTQKMADGSIGSAIETRRTGNFTAQYPVVLGARTGKGKFYVWNPSSQLAVYVRLSPMVVVKLVGESRERTVRLDKSSSGGFSLEPFKR